MTTLRPFRALRPADANAAQRVAALPYDVLSSDEARVAVEGNPDSFLHVDKAEIDLDPSVGLYDDAVYAKAKQNLRALVGRGVLVHDPSPCFFLYRQTMDGRSQTGIVGCAGVDDYLSNRVRKHELTRADKEKDRTRHVDTLDANTGPILLAHRRNQGLAALVAGWVAEHEPVYDFTSEAGSSAVRNEVWRVADVATNLQIAALFTQMPALYIADGHHRCASAVNVAQRRRVQNPGHRGDEEFNYFLAVVFPEDQLHIMDYNRVVADRAGRTPEQLLAALTEVVTVGEPQVGPYRPAAKHEFGMYTDGSWYPLQVRPDLVDESDPVASLDAAWLQDRVLDPLLGVANPRADQRIDFVGGSRGLDELARRAGQEGVAFALFPVGMGDLFAVADAGQIMPPKSTWFEPKLLSGLFIHPL
ncbi:MAG: DUF1015 family protein [Micrococcales bacterium]|nr:DUF1015 family protein [Micrococcales bacterium]MCL2666675.1 DUF1015 family protein [Micrococcales bacterium]